MCRARGVTLIWRAFLSVGLPWSAARTKISRRSHDASRLVHLKMKLGYVSRCWQEDARPVRRRLSYPSNLRTIANDQSAPTPDPRRKSISHPMAKIRLHTTCKQGAHAPPPLRRLPKLPHVQDVIRLAERLFYPCHPPTRLRPVVRCGVCSRARADRHPGRPSGVPQPRRGGLCSRRRQSGEQ